MLRALAETVGHIADFAIDEVADIRLALDEVATALVLDAVPGSDLDCELDYAEDRMSVRVRGVCRSKEAVAQSGFGWHIVRTLTDSVEATQESYDFVVGGYRTAIGFEWSRRIRSSSSTIIKFALKPRPSHSVGSRCRKRPLPANMPIYRLPEPTDR
ncbi:anti-sigma factor [Nocardia farcinica]|uniref:anti-sigma factor n=1 Tax=Nocardia farcinica TaxID=37329 RepID=UPI002455261F|nr:anti-sigma factor [Nocardia farcinica]